MPKYEVKVTATWWINVEATSKDEAAEIAHMNFLGDGSYDGVDDILVYESDDNEEE